MTEPAKPPKDELLDLHCAHGKSVTSRCRQCEQDVHMGKGNGFTQPRAAQVPAEKSDTPRTDAKVRFYVPCGYVVDADFARQLERELAAMTTEPDTPGSQSLTLISSSQPSVHDQWSPHHAKTAVAITLLGGFRDGRIDAARAARQKVTILGPPEQLENEADLFAHAVEVLRSTLPSPPTKCEGQT